MNFAKAEKSGLNHVKQISGFDYGQIEENRFFLLDSYMIQILFQLKNLLEKAVKERCDTWSDRQELLELGLPVPPPKTSKASSKVGQEEYTPFIDESADLPTIHEAYQYLNKGY